MSDPYHNWIDREARDSMEEQDDIRMLRFLPSDPEPEIVCVTLDRHETCAICRNPLFFGELAWICETTHQVGCCKEHAREAAEVKLRLMTAQ